MASMTYEEWCDYKEMVMGETPAWFDDPAERERRYQEYHDASEGNCTEANPLDANLVLTSQQEINVVTPAPAVIAATSAADIPSRSFAQHIWAIAIVIALNVVVLTGAAFAGGNGLVVNGKTLSMQERASLESIVGPLKDGRYWARENGDFGRAGVKTPMVNIRDVVNRRLEAARMQRRLQLQQMVRQQMMARAMQNAIRQRQAMQQRQQGYMYGNRFSSGERYGNGSWSHYNGYSNYGVGGTANGCIYTPNWSNC